MKRIFVLGVLALGLALGVPSIAGAIGNDVNGPACADIIPGTDGFYSSTGRLEVDLALGAASCPYVTYTLYVLNGSGTQLLVDPISVSGDGSRDILPIITNLDPAITTICVYATTSIGRHVFDRAQDSNCTVVTQSSSPGFSGFS
jgi:hypothetical protein